MSGDPQRPPRVQGPGHGPAAGDGTSAGGAAPQEQETAAWSPDAAEDPAPPLAVDALAGDRYELGDVLGAGGMGLVRRARDGVLERDVAVKLLADNLAADADARERFLREARAAAAITDPNVVTVHDVGEDAGRPWLVMELLEGGSLADSLRSAGPLPAERVLRVADDALRGLAAAHDAGIVHRDVKPGNLLVRSDGRIAMTDLGVAEAADAPALTRTGFVMGTAAYLAPERRTGGPASVATDLYALGVTLIELLDGEAPDPVADWRPASELPSELAALLWALLAEEPADRPTTARDALALLRETAADAAAPASSPAGATELLAAAEAPDAAATPDVGATAPMTTSGPPWWIWLVAAAAVVLVAGLVATFGGEQDGGSPDEPAQITDGVERQDDPADTARELAEWLRERSG